jgi:uncharacterized RDD family membrane protein YckC
MDNAYYIQENGEQTGPFTFDELIEKEPGIHTRILSPEENTWQDACDAPELYDYFREQGIYFPTEDNLASFGIRLLAFVIDMILLMFFSEIILQILVSRGLFPNIQSLNSLQAYSKLPANQLLILELVANGSLILYNAICEASPMKGSLGKRILRLVVVNADGEGISFPNALARSLGKVVSLSFWGIGFISIFFTEHKQALHDFLAKTYVIKRDA